MIHPPEVCNLKLKAKINDSKICIIQFRGILPPIVYFYVPFNLNIINGSFAFLQIKSPVNDTQLAVDKVENEFVFLGRHKNIAFTCY